MAKNSGGSRSGCRSPLHGPYSAKPAKRTSRTHPVPRLGGPVRRPRRARAPLTPRHAHTRHKRTQGRPCAHAPWHGPMALPPAVPCAPCTRGPVPGAACAMARRTVSTMATPGHGTKPRQGRALSRLPPAGPTLRPRRRGGGRAGVAQQGAHTAHRRGVPCGVRHVKDHLANGECCSRHLHSAVSSNSPHGAAQMPHDVPDDMEESVTHAVTTGVATAARVTTHDDNLFPIRCGERRLARRASVRDWRGRVNRGHAPSG